MRTPRNTRKISDNPGDVLLSRKTVKTSDIGELFYDFQNNVLKYKRGANDVIPVGGDAAVQEFLIYNMEDNIVFTKTGNTVGGQAEWMGSYYGEDTYLRFDDLAMEWKIIVNAIEIGQIAESNPSDVPPSGDWGAPSLVVITHYTGTLQEVLEKLGSEASISRNADYIQYNNNTSGLNAVNVKAAIDELASAIPQTTQTIITITPTATNYDDGRPSVASGILAMGTSPIELLPAIANSYYEGVIKLELDFGTVGYTYGKNLVIKIGNELLRILPSSFIISLSDGVYAVYLLDLTNANIPLGASVSLATDDLSSPTLGDGILRAIITYTVRTFGA